MKMNAHDNAAIGKQFQDQQCNINNNVAQTIVCYAY